MTKRLIACEACARHVREGEARCPFCGAAAPRAPELRTLQARLTRAALHAAGAAGAVVTFNGCSSSEPRSVAFYGAACIDTDSGCAPYVVDAGTDAAKDGPSLIPPDASVDGAGGEDAEAGGSDAEVDGGAGDAGGKD